MLAKAAHRSKAVIAGENHPCRGNGHDLAIRSFIHYARCPKSINSSYSGVVVILIVDVLETEIAEVNMR